MANSSNQLPPKATEDNLRVADERTELLEVIREIVDQEIDAKLKTYLRDKAPPPPKA